MNHIQRKKRSDAVVNAMIEQYQGRTVWSKSLSAVFHVATMADRRRFYFECSKLGLEVQNEKVVSRT